ncbi:MAG: ATP-dependent RecD-like DNA helicase, partial [Acidobacteria bacterium]|nr:ATP-dependent RecD-like DNA helicase [Acidobacteriota bacterium]MYH29926.1 ATP-dependent RecD-like DNA helicase [Acidobacteriota bacterium]
MHSQKTARHRDNDGEVLAGTIQRVSYRNEETGFCVLQVDVRGHREPATIIGTAAAITEGEWLTATGYWKNHPTYGRQFNARFLRSSTPSSTDGIEKYLRSGMIRGIGRAYAHKLVEAFGDKVLDVIDTEPDKLRDVPGIGPKRAERITDAWAEQKAVREIMVFLHEHGASTARAVRILKTYGNDAVEVIRTPASYCTSYKTASGFSL